MQASSVIDIYTSVLGWHIHNNLWMLLEYSGLFLIPFMVIIVRNFIKARESKDKSDIGVLVFRLSEVQIYVAFFTVLLFVKPTINMNFEAVNFTERLCTTGNNAQSDLVPKEWGETGTTFDDTSHYIEASLDGQQIKIPLLWYFFESFLRAFSESAKHSLPCKPDLRTISGDLSSARILDPVLRDETQQFYRDCWRPSANRFLREKPEVNSDVYPNIEEDISWMGSRFFNQHPYYYHRDRPREGLKSFPFVEERDNMIVSESYSDERGWPFCAEWWTSQDHGLRERLLDHFNSTSQARDHESLFERFQRLYQVQLGALTGNEELEDSMLKTLLRSDLRIQGVALSNNYTRDQTGGLLNAATSGVSELLMGFGMVKQNVGHSVEMHTYQFAAPVVQALILMVITLALPILQVVSIYQLDVTFALLMLKFSVIFWSFLFQLAFWLDNYLLEGLMDHSNADGFITSLGTFVGDYDPSVQIINYITRMMYIILPALFSMLMTIAGYHAGSAVADAISTQGKTTAGAGGGAANQVQNLVTKK